jgi:LCP family protein required for cell wall assembly
MRGQRGHSLPGDVRHFYSEHRRLVVIGLATPCALVVASGAFALACWFHIDRVSITFPGTPPDGSTYLLVGSDSRAFVHSATDRATFGTPSDSPGQHADVILLVRITGRGHVTILPIPRDLMTILPDGAPLRITMSLLDGPQTLVDTVCHSLGVGVNHLVLIHMDGLRSLVNDVGGISIHVATPERDTVTGLSIAHSGWNHLSGMQAVAYVRSRHLELFENGAWRLASTADDERSGRASQVLSQLGSRLDISPTTPLSSAKRLWELSGAITVDGGTSPFALSQLAQVLKQLNSATHDELPVTLHPGSVPLADIDPGGGAVLARFDGGTSPNCSLRVPISSPGPATTSGSIYSGRSQ